MNYEQCIIAAAAAGTMVATFVIAFYAIMSHGLAKSNKNLTEELGRAAQDADKRHIQTLQHLAAATFASSITAPSAPTVMGMFEDYLKKIKEQADKDAKKEQH
jgi:hypothetical protein